MLNLFLLKLPADEGKNSSTTSLYGTEVVTCNPCCYLSSPCLVDMVSWPLLFFCLQSQLTTLEGMMSHVITRLQLSRVYDDIDMDKDIPAVRFTYYFTDLL